VSIPYAPKSWNPVVGCQGCELAERCWAIGMARRQKYAAEVLTLDRKHWSGKSVVFEERFAEPLKWREPQVVATCFMGDIAHADAETIRCVFEAMAEAQRHQFLVLTKWPGMLLEKLTFEFLDKRYVSHSEGVKGGWINGYSVGDLGNVWLGTSATDQATYDSRVSQLCDPETGWRGHKWASIEPCFEQINLAPWLGPRRSYDCPGKHGHAVVPCPMCNDSGTVHVGGVGWVITGSADSLAHGAAAFTPEIARSIRDSCREAGVRFWLKQGTRALDPLYYGTQDPFPDVMTSPLLDGATHLEAPEPIAAILRREGKL